MGPPPYSVAAGVRPTLTHAFSGWGLDVRPQGMRRKQGRPQVGGPPAAVRWHPNPYQQIMSINPLQTVWPYLLHYSRDEIAVVDAVCMVSL